MGYCQLGGISAVPRKKDVVWAQRFSRFLSLVFSTYNLAVQEIAQESKVTDSSVRHWTGGVNLPNTGSFRMLEECLRRMLPHGYVHREIEHCVQTDFSEYEDSIGANWLYSSQQDAADYIANSLGYYFQLAIGRPFPSLFDDDSSTSTGFVRAAVFDFAGTLALGLPEDNTWHLIWCTLGLNEREFRRIRGLYRSDAGYRERYHSELEKSFMSHGLTRNELKRAAGQITPIEGIGQAFKTLSDLGIRVCIVSRSERNVIKYALGELLQYVDEIQSNEILFDSNGRMISLVGTEYDFSGKAKYVQRLASELHALPNEIFFIANSFNDLSVSSSGARTICINPSCNVAGSRYWNYELSPCMNLMEIIPIMLGQKQ